MNDAAKMIAIINSLSRNGETHPINVNFNEYITNQNNYGPSPDMYNSLAKFAQLNALFRTGNMSNYIDENTQKPPKIEDQSDFSYEIIDDSKLTYAVNKYNMTIEDRIVPGIECLVYNANINEDDHFIRLRNMMKGIVKLEGEMLHKYTSIIFKVIFKPNGVTYRVFYTKNTLINTIVQMTNKTHFNTKISGSRRIKDYVTDCENCDHIIEEMKNDEFNVYQRHHSFNDMGYLHINKI